MDMDMDMDRVMTGAEPRGLQSWALRDCDIDHKQSCPPANQSEGESMERSTSARVLHDAQLLCQASTTG